MNKSLAALRRANWELYCKTLVLQYFPSGTDAETFASFVRMLRDSASPEVVEQLDGSDPETQSLLSGINVPALVLHRLFEGRVAFPPVLGAPGSSEAAETPESR